MTIWISTTAHAARAGLTPSQRRECRLVVRVVSEATGVRLGDFFAPSRMRLKAAGARQLAMYLCHVLLGLTMTQVGRFFGRDRTTVSYACVQVEDQRDEGGAYDSEVQQIEARISEARNCAPASQGGIGAREGVHAAH